MITFCCQVIKKIKFVKLALKRYAQIVELNKIQNVLDKL